MSDLTLNIMFLILVFICVFYVARIEHHNGRLEMCNEVGMKYLYTDKCITNQTYNNLNGYNFKEFKINNITLGMLN